MRIKKMKLKKVEIDIETGYVECKCLLDIQGKSFPVEFKLLEYDIYSQGFRAGRQSWENDDLINAAKEKLNIDVEL